MLFYAHTKKVCVLHINTHKILLLLFILFTIFFYEECYLPWTEQKKIQPDFQLDQY